ncbi:hypothetical protein DERF_005710 [Dermatophagoides farinae]|uniref:Uncharacterized protein n=1 Tax=Dermatophagoides farinae TaxID=6954 RepID=A0A922I5Y0_DERFA|nr:hypothetical protein DERF_005710 [Dermatophagoides farinae]
MQNIRVPDRRTKQRKKISNTNPNQPCKTNDNMYIKSRKKLPVLRRGEKKRKLYADMADTWHHHRFWNSLGIHSIQYNSFLKLSISITY